MLFYAVSALINAITSTIVVIIVRTKSNRHKLDWPLFRFALCVAFWSYCYFFWQIAGNESSALFWCKALMFGAVFLPAVMFDLSVAIINQVEHYRKHIVFFYSGSLFFALVSAFTSLIVADVRPRSIFPYWPSAGNLFGIFLLCFFWTAIYAHILMFKHYVKLNGVERNKIKYVFLGTAIAFVGGSTNYFLWFDIPILPWGNGLVSVYVVLVAYSIIKYRLMDIKLVITRAGIFVGVYALVLGIPFYVGSKYPDNWLVSVSLMTVFATIGPFVYLFIQKRAEANLLQEQRQYQTTLRQASLGMGRIKNLKRLLNLIVRIVTKTVRIEHCEMYLLHEESDQFVLKASKNFLDTSNLKSSFSSDNEFVRELKNIKEPLMYDEISHRSNSDESHALKDVTSFMERLGVALAVPSFIEDKLIAIIALGNKKSGKHYTDDDFMVFSILANQAGLAIENALFYEDMKTTHEQLYKAEKMATIGTMADGLSHQINNRFHAMGFIAGDAMDTIKLKKKEKLSFEDKGLLDDLEQSFERIEANVKQGGEIVGGLLKYTRKGTQGLEAVDLQKLLTASVEMAQFKINLNEFNLSSNLDEQTPKVLGNFTQLQEVLFNIVDNAYDAMIQRRDELKEFEYKCFLSVKAFRKGSRVEILIEDNGIGVKEKDQAKLFTPFFTTKLSSKKGTGLGLYVIRQIVEGNHDGKVLFTSKYKVGSQTRIWLPAAD